MKYELTRHGGAFDRGQADKYYGREFAPHYFVGATHQSEKITKLTAEQLDAYTRGYDEQIETKDWGI